MTIDELKLLTDIEIAIESIDEQQQLVSERIEKGKTDTNRMLNWEDVSKKLD